MNTLGQYAFVVRSYECGPNGLATLATVCNYLQEAASLHAQSLGFSKSNFAAEGANISWVLARLHVKMDRYPRWNESVTVLTFPRGGRKIVAYRDFELYAGDERLGVATSEWMVIDLATRKLVSVPTRVYELANTERPHVMAEPAFAKLRWDCREACEARTFPVLRGNIDLNGHVNNVHYVEWLAETLPDTAWSIDDIEIAFKSETLAGDIVCAESVEVLPGVWAAHVAASDGRDHVVAQFRVTESR